MTLAHGTQTIQRAVVPSIPLTSPLMMTARNVEAEFAKMSNIVGILPVTAVNGILYGQKAAECTMMMTSEPSPCAVLARVDLHITTLLHLPQLKLSFQF